MNRLAGPALPGQPAAGARRGMRTGMGIFLIADGAVLRFALAAGSPHGLNTRRSASWLFGPGEIPGAHAYF